MKNQIALCVGTAVCAMLLLLSSPAHAQEQATSARTQPTAPAPPNVASPTELQPPPSLFPRLRGAVGATGAMHILQPLYLGFGAGIHGELGVQASNQFGAYAHLMVSTVLFSGAFSLTANAEWTPVPGLSLSAGAGYAGGYFLGLGGVAGLAATLPFGITGNIPLQPYQPGIRRTVLRLGARGGPLFGSHQGAFAAGFSTEVQIGVGWL